MAFWSSRCRTAAKVAIVLVTKMLISVSVIIPVISSLPVNIIIIDAIPSARPATIVRAQFLIVLKARTDDLENALCWSMFVKRR